MGFDSIKGSIEKHFQDNWDAFTPIEFSNILLQKSPNESWVRLTILNGESFMNGFTGGGVNQYRTPGLIVLNIFIPVGGGTSEGDKIADKAKDILRGAHFDGITCFVPSLTEIGIDGDWYQLNLTTPFNIDEIE